MYQLHILPCASILCVCLGDCGLPLALFQVDFRVLVYPTSRQSRWCLSVQKTTPEVTLYKPDTTEESLRRRRAVSHSQVLPGHADQAWELLLVLLPQHERVCVVGHLLHSHVCI